MSHLALILIQPAHFNPSFVGSWWSGVVTRLVPGLDTGHSATPMCLMTGNDPIIVMKIGQSDYSLATTQN